MPDIPAARRPLPRLLLLALVLAAALAGAGYGVYRVRALGSELAEARARAASEAGAASARVAALEADLAAAQEERQDLEEKLRTEAKKNDSFEAQIRRISGTVNVLDRLSKTDPELLQKYSKIYFLNENYAPSRLAEIPRDYAYEDKLLTFHAQALPYLESLVDAAREDGVDLRVASAYRSFTTQAALKSGYRVTYGSGANAFSADQGYSEHQLGTTVDFTVPEVGGTFAGFEKTEAFAWLQDNAYRYGFILSYPAGNAYYQFEPWHWRFVGDDLARHLHREERNFYDLDQRAIDEYLVDLFE